MPFSTRARPEAPVALPLAWDALEAMDAGPSLTVRGVLDAGLPAAAPWADVPQILPEHCGGRR